MIKPRWGSSVLYQVDIDYPRSFADSNGDGIGDLAVLIGKLDHLSPSGGCCRVATRRK